MTPTDTLIFSVALGGYGRAFRKCIDSQRIYASRYGYDYACIEDVNGRSDLGMSSAWLKIPMILGALEKGYRQVVFVDADIEITADTPDIIQEMAKQPERGIFGVLGHSGRVNSGMIAVRDLAEVRRSLANILSRAGTYLPEKSAVSLWGENGQVIHELSGNPVFGELDVMWNNTFDLQMQTGFRHYTGPMRDLYTFTGDEAVAWQDISVRRFERDDRQCIDRPVFFTELARNYRLIAEADDRFAPLRSEWFRGQIVLGGYVTPARSAVSSASGHNGLQVHFCHDVDLSQQSTNPYIDQLAGGLVSMLGKDAVQFGVDEFWTKDYTGIDAVHFQWIEVLSNWKKPDADLVWLIAERLDEIRRTTRIIYTLHNIDLKADFDEMAEPLMDAICSRADAIIHLSQASVTAFRERYAAYSWAHSAKAAIIRHGSYDCYFDETVDASDPATPANHIYICGAIRTQAEWQLAQDVAARAEAAGYPVVFTGNVSSSVLHWKERQAIEQQSSPLCIRRHSRVETSEMVRYARSARCFFLPRVDRLNSGVWYLATTFARPCIVPDQMSLREDQQAVDGLCYRAGDAQSAFEAIERVYAQTVAEKVQTQKKLMKFSRDYMTWDTICRAHAAVYRDGIPGGAL